MSVVMQEVVVTIVALAAVVVVLRQFVFRKKDAPPCPSCTSGHPCAPASDEAPASEASPLTFIRPSSSRSRHPHS